MSQDPDDNGGRSAVVRFLGVANLVVAAVLTASSFFRARPGDVPALAGATDPDGIAPRLHATTHAAEGQPHPAGQDRAPGDEQEDGSEPGIGHVGYAVGLGLAVLLTAIAFGLVRTGLVWGPSIPIAISVLAVAQMGVHLVFFLHIGSGPDSTNNIMALAFGVLIVFLLIAGSLWIMSHLNHNMMPMDHIMRMQR